MKLGLSQPTLKLLFIGSILASMQTQASLVTANKKELSQNEQLSYYLSTMENNSILAAENTVVNIPIEIEHQFINKYQVISDNTAVSGGVINSVLTLTIDEVEQDTAVVVSLIKQNDRQEVALNIVINVLDKSTYALPNYAIVLAKDNALTSTIADTNVLSIKSTMPIGNNIERQRDLTSNKHFQNFAQVTDNQSDTNKHSLSRGNEVAMNTLSPELFFLDNYLPANQNVLIVTDAHARKDTIVAAFKDTVKHYKPQAQSFFVMPSTIGDNSNNATQQDEQNQSNTNEQSNVQPSEEQPSTNESFEVDKDQSAANNVPTLSAQNSPPLSPIIDNDVDNMQNILQIPEPSTTAMFALALVSLMSRIKFKKG